MVPAAQPSNNTLPEGGYEAALARIQALAQALEDPSLPFDEAVARYQEAQALIDQCRQHLEGAELRLQELVEPQASNTSPQDDADAPLRDLDPDEA